MNKSTIQLNVTDTQNLPHSHEGEGAMFLVFVTSCFGMQALVLWLRSRHPLQFKTGEAAALWLIPFAIALSNVGTKDAPYRFIIAWLLFTGGNFYVAQKSVRERPLQPKTPRLIYRWYQRTYQVCSLMNMIGYALFSMDLFGFSSWQVFSSGSISNKQHGDNVKGNPWFFETAVMCWSYGVYFGMLARDSIDLLSAHMAASVGYYVKDGGLPNKHLRAGVCALCGDAVAEPDRDSSEQSRQHTHDKQMSMLMPSVRLQCRHVYHTPCIRGWVLVGKKDACPYCKERINYKELAIDRGQNVWDANTTVAYLWLVDTVRFFVVYVPLLVVFTRLMYYLLGLRTK